MNKKRRQVVLRVAGRFVLGEEEAEKIKDAIGCMRFFIQDSVT